MPEILEFWLLQTVLLWLLLIGTLPVTGFPFKLKPGQGVTLISILLFVVNFFGSIRYILDLDNDLYYAKTKPIKDVATNKDMILLQDGWIIGDFLSYYTPAEVRVTPASDTARASLDQALQHCIGQGGKIYIYTEDRSMTRPASSPYIDSLLEKYRGNKIVFNKSNPEILEIDAGK